MIDPTGQLAAMIRAQFAAQADLRSANRTRPHTEAPVSASPTPAASGVAISKEERIRRSVALRVGALSPDDPQRQRKAFRIFLESVLTQELARIRIDERRFDQMVDEVLVRMEADDSLRAAIREAGDLLLGGNNELPAHPLPK